MKRVTYIIVTLVAAFGLTSCNLDLKPETGMLGSDITSVRHIEALRNGIYDNMTSAQSYGNQVYQEYYVDLFNETSNSGNRGGFFSQWLLTASDQDVNAVWSMYYSVISNINYVLMKADDVMQLNPSDAKEITLYKAEITFFRAMMLHQIALRFCQDYDPAKANRQLGIPTPTKYDPYAKLNRGTLEDTYTQILEDVAFAEQHLTEAGKPENTRLSADAVLAFKAQLALHMHDYTNAIDYAGDLFGTYPLSTNREQVQDMWHKDTSNEIIMQGALTTTSLGLVSGPADYLNGTYDFDNEIFDYTAAYVPEQWVVDLYDVADWRRSEDDPNTGTGMGKSWIGIESLVMRGPEYVEGCYAVTKFSGNTDLFIVPTSLTYANKTKFFRVAEMYLIQAEAQYRLDGDALTPLNALRRARGLADLPASCTGDELFKEIKNEWTREFIGEGIRLFNLKRWGDGFKRNYQPKLKEHLEGAAKVYAMPRQANDVKFVWPIPLEELHANSKFGDQNEGWTSVQ